AEAQGFGNFVTRQAAEKTHFDNSGLSGVKDSKSVQSFVERQQIYILRFCKRFNFVRCSEIHLPAAFFGRLLTQRINQNIANHTGNKAVKMGTVLPGNRLCLRQPDESFVNKYGGLKQTVGTELSKFAPGYAAQFVINKRCEFIESLSVAIAPGK